MTLPFLPIDKANHALYGAAIFAVFGGLAALAHASMPRLIGVVAALAFALGKEAADYFANRRAAAAGIPPPHGVEALDVAATVGGALLSWAASAATGA